MSADDLFRLRYVSDPQIAPAGDRVAFVVTVIDREADKYQSALHQMPLEGGAPEPLTEGTWPRWSPDGKRMAYLREKQVWVREESGETRKLADLGEVSFLAWSPDGGRLAVLAEVPLPTNPAGPTEGLHHITRLKYKEDSKGFTYATRDQLFVVDVATGRALQITDTPSGVESPSWSPDGRRIGLITCDQDPDGTWDRRVVTVAADGGPMEPVCAAIGAQDLSWSPDGSLLAFRAAWGAYEPPINFGLWVAPAGGGEPVHLTPGFDPFVGNDRTTSDSMYGKLAQGGVWAADSRSLYTIVADRGENALCEISVEGGDVRRVNRACGPQAVFNFSYCPATGALVAAAGTPLIPGDLWSVGDGRRLTGLNDAWLAEVELSAPELVEWSSADGTRVEGWVLKPPAFDPARRYPAILEIHGGPHRQYGMTFFHEMQMLAARGYVVLYSNPRGSQGYGWQFARAIQDDWGHHDYDDLMAGVDHLLAQGYVDPKRLGVTGGSYGGYMTDWMVTQTDRFAAAVTDRSLSNVHSFLGTADCAITFGEPIFGNVWQKERLPRMFAQSPISFVANVTTPLLIMHQMEDHTCPLEQGEQFYLALKRLGRPVEMVLFPGACHELSRSGRPKQRLQRLQWIAGWFDRYLNP